MTHLPLKAQLLIRVRASPLSANEELFRRACDVIPGGVDSPVRAFGKVGGTPYFVARAEGAYVWDVAGRRYTDYVQSWGASILGHAHPHVVEAVQRAAADGTSFGAPTEREVLLAEAIRERMPSCQRVRLVNSGTEATMTAVRVARGFTGRDRVVVFDGCYHGHSDTLLAAGGSGLATLGLPGSAGVPKAAVADTVVVPYNVVPDVGDDVACVIVEPVAANMGLVPPAHRASSRASGRPATAAGALLIFDEVITGFRLGLGGAQGLFGVTPDLTCMGKVIGGGLPLAAFGGRADVMSMLAPEGPVYQAGTLSGNPLATAAGLAVLELLDEAAYVQLAGRAAELAAWLTDVIAEAGLAVQVPVVGPLMGLFFADAAAPRLRLGQGGRRRPLRPVLPPDARPGRRPAAEPVRGPVPEPGPHQERARAHRRPGRRRRPRHHTDHAAHVRLAQIPAESSPSGPESAGLRLNLLARGRSPRGSSFSSSGSRSLRRTRYMAMARRRMTPAEHADLGHGVLELLARLAQLLLGDEGQHDDLLDRCEHADDQERLGNQAVLGHDRPDGGKQLQQDEDEEQPVQGLGRRRRSTPSPRSFTRW